MTAKTTYRLVEAATGECVQETDYRLRCQAERALAERRADLAAEGYSDAPGSCPSPLVCRLVAVAPDGETETVRLFIEAITPLVTTTVRDRDHLAELLGIPGWDTADTSVEDYR